MLNKELNQFYIYKVIISISLSLISFFIPIYFYQLGFSLSKIIFFFFLISLYFFIFTLFTPRIITKFGIRHTILFSMLPLVIYFLSLNYINSYPILFFISPFFIALNESLLWVGYHIYFLKYSNEKSRGKQLSFNYIIIILTSLIGPLFGALLITNLGYVFTYTIGALLAFFSVIPLFFSREFKAKLNFNYKDLFKYFFNKKNFNSNISFIGYSIESEIDRILWPIFIFIILKEILQVGFIVFLTTFVSLVIVFFMGKLTDLKNKISLIKIGSIFVSISWFLRIFVNTKLKILFIDTFRISSNYALKIPWETYAYNISKKRKYFEYFVARELIFKGTRIVVLPLFILIFYLFSLKIAFVLVFITSGFASLLYAKIKA